MDHQPLPPRDYCKVPLPVAIDDIARDDPTRTWASLPVDDWDLAQGFEDISYRRLARAINKVAHALDAAFGRLPTRTTGATTAALPTLAYVGIPDVRYQIAQVAAVKAGYQVLLSSPLNSTNIHCSLMDQTKCVAILSAVGVSGVAEVLRCRPALKHATVAELDDLLGSSSSDDDDDDDDKVPAYPFTKTWAECAHEPYMILHSSGTTAAPKPVVYTHLYYGRAWALVFLPDVRGRRHFHRLTYPGAGTRFLLATAPWHAMAAACSLQMGVFGRGVLCPGFRHRAMGTGDDVAALLARGRVTVAALTPWMMEDVARRADAKECIERLDAVLFGGAVLSPLAGEIWSKYTHIQNGWGATEAMATALLEADPQDHAYVYFDTHHTGVAFRPSPAEFFDVTNTTGTAGGRLPLFELVLTMDDETAPYASWHFRQGWTPETWRQQHGAGTPYPEYRIGDLWTPHPDPAKAGYAFRFVGRVDDTFTLSSASNIHPGPVERAVAAHPRVQGVVVVGDGRRQPAALVELRPPRSPRSPPLDLDGEKNKPGGAHSLSHEHDDDDVDDLERLADDIFDAVVRPANANMPAHATLRRTHLALVPAGALVRTANGFAKVVRQATIAKHAGLIDALYRDHGDQWQAKQGRFNSITATTEIKVEVVSSQEETAASSAAAA